MEKEQEIQIILVDKPVVTDIQVSTNDPFFDIGKRARFAHDTSPETFKVDGLEIVKGDVFSVAEQVWIDIECEISERLARQINRHRHMAIVQKSTRYNSYLDKEAIAFYLPKNADPERMIDHYKQVLSEILNLEKQGVELEEMNYLLPLSTITKVHYQMNLRTLIRMCHVRLCRQALSEFNEFLEAVKEKLGNISSDWYYITKVFLIPHCLTHTDISCVAPLKECSYREYLGNHQKYFEEFNE